MADHTVRNEVNAVRSLMTGITRYSEQIRAAVASARNDLRAAQTQAEDTVGRRRKGVQRAERQVAEARDAVANVQDERGRAQAEQRLRAAMQWLGETKQAAYQAQRAVQTIATIRSEIVGVLQAAEHAVAEQSSIASSALASLDAKLRELPHMDLGRSVQHAVAGGLIGMEMFGASMNLGRIGSNALAAGGINPPLRDTSITQLVERDQQEDEDYVIKDTAERERLIRSSQSEETIA